jgi:hypothetical protein
LLKVVDGSAVVDLDCSPSLEAMGDRGFDVHAFQRAFERLTRVPHVSGVTGDNGTVVVHMRVPEASTCGELYRLREIFQIIVNDAARAARDGAETGASKP